MIVKNHPPLYPNHTKWRGVVFTMGGLGVITMGVWGMWGCVYGVYYGWVVGLLCGRGFFRSAFYTSEKFFGESILQVMRSRVLKY